MIFLRLCVVGVSRVVGVLCWMVNQSKMKCGEKRSLNGMENPFPTFLAISVLRHRCIGSSDIPFLGVLVREREMIASTFSLLIGKGR